MDNKQIVIADIGAAGGVHPRWDRLSRYAFFLLFEPNAAECKKLRAGYTDQRLLSSMVKDPYFKRPAPKSTGREYFHLDWLEHQLQAHQSVSPAGVLTTLAELTCVTIADEIEKHRVDTVLVCGGGVKNGYLMERLQNLLTNRLVTSTQTAGIDPDFVEAIAFAWFGYQTLNRKTSNCPSVTGATGPRILGAIYPN
mgnify:CR=1 FL=1